MGPDSRSAKRDREDGASSLILLTFEPTLGSPFDRAVDLDPRCIVLRPRETVLGLHAEDVPAGDIRVLRRAKDVDGLLEVDVFDLHANDLNRPGDDRRHCRADSVYSLMPPPSQGLSCL